ncbi:MAG: 30S ribosomal protein S4e [Candidatus Nanoarchaeia archaeon]|nr:30S ribosomal protein S4e [Candidatus Nanoarchaeia archaeon]MDD5239659.1 30S ribosomal protein S4e [Candidatus Nanoarchaeia archaeon]
MTTRHTAHMKRIAAPKKYHILRKKSVYLLKTMPGAHKAENSLPIAVLLRDMMKLVDSSREAKRILNDNKVLVDQKVRKELRLPVGLMDVISITPLNENFRILFGMDGRIKLIRIPHENAKFKLCKILDKTKISNGRLQLNLHDGRNIITEDSSMKTGDTLKISLPDQKVLKHIALEKGVKVMITDGKHIGEIAVLDEFKPQPGSKQDRVILTAENGDKFETLKNYIFVIGKENSEIRLKEE